MAESKISDKLREFCVAQEYKKRGYQSKDKAAICLYDLLVMRFDEGRTLKQIGEVFERDEERIRQIIGEIRVKARKARIPWPEDN